MNWFRNLGLATKSSVVIALVVIAFFALTTFLSYRQQRDFILAEATEKARIIASQAIRAREYISDQLEKGAVELSLKRYGLIPVVSSTRIGEQVAEDLDYRIRQISSRYRNPKNAPDAFEAEVLQSFYDEPYREEAYAVTTLDGEHVFRYLQPFRAEESCLECHGDPAAAPDYIKRLFPEESDRAYHYQIGEIIGAASVTIPMTRLDAQIAANLRNGLLSTGGVFLALIAGLGLLIRLAVTRPLGRLAAAIGEIIRTGRFEETLPRRGRDEIGSLIDGFNEMISHLREKTAHLEESERRFRILTETASDGIVSFLSNGQVILFNRQAERMFGYSKREALGVSVERLVHEDCTSFHSVRVEDYLRERGDELLEGVHRLPGRRRDGSRLELELSLSAAESDGHRFFTAILRERG